MPENITGPEQKQELTVEECFEQLEELLKKSKVDDYEKRLEDLKNLFNEKRVSIPLEEYDELKETARANAEKCEELEETVKKLTEPLAKSLIEFSRRNPREYNLAEYVYESIVKNHENLLRVKVERIYNDLMSQGIKLIYEMDFKPNV